jgi:outer membrane usher protein
MAKRHERLCLRLILLAEIALTAVPLAAREEAERPPDMAMRGASELADVTLYLEARVNGRPAGLADFTLRDEELWATPATLARLGLVVEAGMGSVRLAGVPGLAVEYDAAGQSVSLTAGVAMLDQATSIVREPRPPTSPLLADSGLVYNYSVFGGIHGSSRSASAFSELRAFHPLGTASSTFLTQASGEDGDWAVDSVRLDTSATASLPERMLAVTVGDTIGSATAWSRVTRFGGIRAGTDFTLQPYTATTPLTQFFGEAALPSTVELYVDGLKQATGEVPPGPFEIAAPNGAAAGAGAGRVVITDALGRVSTLSFDIYHAPILLRPGLADWSVEAGFLRRDYGLRSFAYAPDPFVSGTMRRGMSNYLTLEAHGEFSARLALAGVGANWRAGQLGVVSGSVASSSDGARSGVKYTLGYAWSNDTSSVSFDLARAGRGFRDGPALEGSILPRRALSVQANHSAARLGTFSVSYVDLTYREQPRSRFLAAHWSASLGDRFGVSLHAAQDLERRRNRTLFAGLSVRLSNRTQASASAQRERRATFASVEATQSVSDAGGVGWRAQLRRARGRADAAGELRYLGAHGEAVAGAHLTDGQLDAYAGASGAVVVIGGSVFAARQVNDSFAVVSTGGVADVPVKLRNNVVGRTGRGGKLLVSGLNAYEDNAIGIDVSALPADVRVGIVETAVKPGDRSGAVVTFELARVRAATIVLTDPAGRPLPVGSAVALQSAPGGDAVVGFDGETYLEGLERSNEVDVRMGGARCTARFDLPSDAGVLPRIGPVVCMPYGIVRGD